MAHEAGAIRGEIMAERGDDGRQDAKHPVGALGRTHGSLLVEFGFGSTTLPIVSLDRGRCRGFYATRVSRIGQARIGQAGNGASLQAVGPPPA